MTQKISVSPAGLMSVGLSDHDSIIAIDNASVEHTFDKGSMAYFLGDGEHYLLMDRRVVRIYRIGEWTEPVTNLDLPDSQESWAWSKPVPGSSAFVAIFTDASSLISWLQLFDPVGGAFEDRIAEGDILFDREFAFSPDRQYVVLVRQGTLEVWSVPRNRRVFSRQIGDPSLPVLYVRRLLFTKDSDLVVVDREDQVSFWRREGESWQKNADVNIPPGQPFTDVILSKDSSRIAVAHSGQIFVLRLPSLDVEASHTDSDRAWCSTLVQFDEDRLVSLCAYGPDDGSGTGGATGLFFFERD